MIDVPVRRVSEWSRLLEEKGLSALMNLGTRGYDWIPYSERSLELSDGPAVPEEIPHAMEIRLLAILDDLVSINPEEWSERVNDVLQGISPEIDLARVSVRTTANLRQEDHSEPPVVITTAPGRDRVDIVEQGGYLHYWKAEMMNVIHSSATGFRADAYALPIAHDYSAFSNGTYIGSIYLFRKVDRGPFSIGLRSLITRLERQMTAFLLTRVLWKQSRNPLLTGFGEAVRSMSIPTPLTSAEIRVAALLLAGEGDEDIAGSLSISIHTVHNHKQSIYRKTGVSSLGELYRRLLSGRLFDR